MRKRLLAIAFAFVLILGLILWRLVGVQILEHKQWLSQAKSAQERTVEIPSRRGRIYDRNGNLLALNKKAYSIAIDSYNMTKPEILIEILQQHLDRESQELEELVYRQSYFTWIERQVEYEVAMDIKDAAEEAEARGLIFVDGWKRVYPYQDLAGHILGFTGLDGQGLAGLEYSMNQELSGEPEIKKMIYGADQVPYRETIIQQSTPGADVHLTIDSTIQHVTETEIKEGVEKFEAKQGWAIVMDPRNGEVLAMAQDETYDPNRYKESPPERQSNLPLSTTFEPGSILKVFTALAALEEGVASPQTVVNGDSPIQISNHNVHNSQYKDWGQVTLEEVITHSINTGMIRIAQRLGQANLYDFLNKAGFGSKTGIELSGEESGNLRPLRSWSDLAIGAVSIGQSLSVTAIQLISRMAAVANGGELIEPTVVKSLEKGGNKIDNPRTDSYQGRLASQKTVEEVKTMLRQVVVEGTGQTADIPGFEVCSKSGTAQKAQPGGGYYSDRYISSFAGFFPKESPRFLILVVLDEVGTKPVWGGETAGEVFRQIAVRIGKSDRNPD
ncbi:MAG: peptidoglycan D,D-transpeptidase FtsI family protein [Candidatus Bipolaricaulota bacterium]